MRPETQAARHASPEPVASPALDRHDAPQPPKTHKRVRRYEISYLDEKGNQGDFSVHARALTSVENAFAAFAHNAVIYTRRGYLAVEDVWPGDEVRLPNGDFETLLWRGKITLAANIDAETHETLKLTRFTADALGLDRPDSDILLGPAARLLHRAQGIRKITGAGAAYIPASDFVDGNTILSLVPTRPTPVFQLGFARQCGIMVGGLEFETLHPGTPFELGLRGDGLRQYLSFFPHKRSFEDFGLPRYAHLRLSDLDLIRD